MVTAGIDIGSHAIKVVLLAADGAVIHRWHEAHQGRVGAALARALTELDVQHPLRDIPRSAVVGRGAEWLAGSVELGSVNEVAALIEGARALEPAVRSVIEIGAESSRFVTNLGRDAGTHPEFAMSANCAAGTGAFLEEQISRLDLSLSDYAPLVAQATRVPRIAGRCSVFSKTDIIHHQQEGASIADILLGLAYSVARNFRAAVVKKRPVKSPCLFVGGTAHNPGIVRALTEVFSLDPGALVVPDDGDTVSARGAALLALRQQQHTDLPALLSTARDRDAKRGGVADAGHSGRLALQPLAAYGDGDGADKHDAQVAAPASGPVSCFLGVDVGSTSTNLVLVDDDARLLAHRYLRTRGDPRAAVTRGLRSLEEEFGGRLDIRSTATTGSGRAMIGKALGAEVVVNEITAQATAAQHLDAEVDTVLEIGGQDSKFLRLADGRVTQFEMNKVCAAGTGSFLEEQAKKLDIAVEEIGPLALQSRAPTNLGERCTVFMETNIAAAVSRGASRPDLAAGLCYAVAKNYLNRVVNKQPLGTRILFQGGVAHNQGVVNALRSLLPDREIIVPPFFSVTGAIGAALLARRDHQTRVERPPQHAAATANASASATEPPIGDMGEAIERLLLRNYDPTIDPAKKTVGVPRVLFLHKLFAMFSVFFRQLGYNVIYSDMSDEETVRLSQEHALDETCYPVKLINGHVAQLLERGVDYIFLPALCTMKYPISRVREDYACAYMQCAPRLVNQTMDLPGRGVTLLSPTISFKFGKRYMIRTLMGLGRQLGAGRLQSARAVVKGMLALTRFLRDIEQLGEDALAGLRPDDKAFVLVSRAYGTNDPMLNMGIPERLRELGHQVLTLDNLPTRSHDMYAEHPNMYWPFGQHILAGAQIIREHPNLYAIYLTNHGCGPDTMLAHFFGEEMGDKPYLHIEVDEHTSSVGVATRLEAFLSSLAGETVAAGERKLTIKETSESVAHRPVNLLASSFDLPTDRPLLVPHLWPYSELLQALLARQGVSVECLPRTDDEAIDRGRQFTLTKEYYTFTALFGDVFRALDEDGEQARPPAVFLPTSEGSEATGQYHRLMRTKLDEGGHGEVAVVAPFLEDVLDLSPPIFEGLATALLAGDLIRLAPPPARAELLARTVGLLAEEALSVAALEDLAAQVTDGCRGQPRRACLLAVGDPSTLFNDYLNDHRFTELEAEGVQVLYAPLAEAMWMFWRDFLARRGRGSRRNRANLDHLAKLIARLHGLLGSLSPFADDPASLVAAADDWLGHFYGGNGRYRLAKTLTPPRAADGLLTVSSMYENTGIALASLLDADPSRLPLPRLNLVFDGGCSQSDELKLQTFLHYLQPDNAAADPAVALAPPRQRMQTPVAADIEPAAY